MFLIVKPHMKKSTFLMIGLFHENIREYVMEKNIEKKYKNTMKENKKIVKIDKLIVFICY